MLTRKRVRNVRNIRYQCRRQFMLNETKSTYILADKQATEDELFIDGGKHAIACF